MPLFYLNPINTSYGPWVNVDPYPIDYLTAFPDETTRLLQCGTLYAGSVYNGLVSYQADTGEFWILIDDQNAGLATSWQLYKDYLILHQNNSFIGTNHFTGSISVSGSSILFIGTQTQSGSLFVSGSTQICGSADIYGPFRVFTGTNNQPALHVSSSGLFILGPYNTLPSAQYGALAFSGSDLYAGL